MNGKKLFMKLLIENFRDKIYWFRVRNRLSDFLKKHNQQKILLYGYPKSGNTWVRFLIFNYFNLINNPNCLKTLTFDELNEIQSNVMDRGTINNNVPGFPLFYRTHKVYNDCYKLFDFKIFVHRNPLDTLVSSYYFYKNRSIPFNDEEESVREKLNDINFYVRYKFPAWKDFFDKSMKIADFTINYSNLKKDPVKILSLLLKNIDVNYCDITIKKSVDLSSFQSIKNMSKNYNQSYGNAPTNGTFVGEFLRSGEDGQYKKELDDKTIEYIYLNFKSLKKIYFI